MIFPERLYAVTIIGPRQEQDMAVGALQRLGALHITTATHTHERLEREGSLADVERVSSTLVKLRWLAEQAGAEPQKELPALQRREDALTDAERLLTDVLTRAESLVAAREEHKKTVARIAAQQGLLAELPEITIRRTQQLTTETYRSPEPLTVRIRRGRVEHHRRHKQHYYTITLPRSGVQELREHLQGTPAKRLDLAFIQNTTAEAAARLRDDRARAEAEKQRSEQELKALLAPRRGSIAYLCAALERHYDQCTITNRFQRSRELSVVHGYAPKKDLSRIAKALPGAHVHAEPAGEDAPTKLVHGPISKHFSPITELFSTPRYQAVDPTRLLALFYPLFFGIMLSDVGYGLLLLAGTIALRILGNEDLQAAVPILGLSALSTIAFGIAFGSFFGGLIPITPLYGDSFGSAMDILLASLALGLVHLNLGVILRITQGVRQEQGAWRITKDAAPLVLLQGAAVAFILGQHWIGAAIIALAAGILVARGGILGIMDLSGYLGTWFSYARLLALGLATAGVALAVNTIASQLHALGALGIVLAVLTLILGHAFNFIVNLIGSAINAARLNYVEFFGLFFEGGGQKFTPFSINNGGKK